MTTSGLRILRLPPWRMVQSGLGRCSHRGSAEPFDGVEAKGVDPNVALGRLVGFVQGVPYSQDLVETTMVRPETFEAGDDPPYHGVEQLGDGVRDVLASVVAEQVPELSAQWSAIEEFGGQADTDGLAELLTGLAALSRRAKAAGDHLFCWWSRVARRAHLSTLRRDERHQGHSR